MKSWQDQFHGWSVQQPVRSSFRSRCLPTLRPSLSSEQSQKKDHWRTFWWDQHRIRSSIWTWWSLDSLSPPSHLHQLQHPMNTKYFQQKYFSFYRDRGRGPFDKLFLWWLCKLLVGQASSRDPPGNRILIKYELLQCVECRQYELWTIVNLFFQECWVAIRKYFSFLLRQRSEVSATHQIINLKIFCCSDTAQILFR